MFLEECLQFIVAGLPASFGQLGQPLEVGLSRRTGCEQDQQRGGLTRFVAEPVEAAFWHVHEVTYLTSPPVKDGG